MSPPARGLAEVSDPAALAAAVAPPGKGGLCEGATYQAQWPVRVYRVWDASANNMVRSWWSFDYPAGTREQYRTDYVICKSYSTLDRIAVCTMKQGTKVVIGTGQSATCPDGVTYAQSPVNQLYIPRDELPQQLEDCVVGDWPQGR